MVDVLTCGRIDFDTVGAVVVSGRDFVSGAGGGGGELDVGVGIDIDELRRSFIEGCEDDLVVIEVEVHIDVGEVGFEGVEDFGFGAAAGCDVKGQGGGAGGDGDVSTGLVGQRVV